MRPNIPNAACEICLKWELQSFPRFQGNALKKFFLHPPWNTTPDQLPPGVWRTCLTIPFSHTPFFFLFNVGVASLLLSLRVGSHLPCKLVLVVGQSQGSGAMKNWSLKQLHLEELLKYALHSRLGELWHCGWGATCLFWFICWSPVRHLSVKSLFYHFNEAFRTAFIPRPTSVFPEFVPNVSALCFNKDFGNCNCVSSSSHSARLVEWSFKCQTASFFLFLHDFQRQL